MSAPKLAEGTATLILNYLQANLPSALNSVSVARGDNFVGLESPREYFLYERARGYQAPAIFVIPEDVDFKLSERASNFINASIKVNVAAIIEDREAELLTYKAWRYQSALHQLLNQTTLTSADNAVTITVTIDHARFSGLYTNAADEKSPEAVFRKEVLLECEVIHRENY